MNSSKKNPTSLKGIRPALLATVACFLVLNIIAQLLTVRTGYGVEDYLGWVNADAIEAMHGEWHEYKVSFLVVAYLLIDTMVFIPLYGYLFFALSDKFIISNAKDKSTGNSKPIDISSVRKLSLSSLLSGLLIFLLIVDLLENISGLLQFSARSYWADWAGGILFAGCVLIGVLAIVNRSLKTYKNDFINFILDLNFKWILSLLLICTTVSIFSCLKHSPLTPLVWAHQIKSSVIVRDDFHLGFAVIYLLLLFGLILAWFFGFCFDAKKAQEEKKGYSEQNKPVTLAYEARSKFRRAIGHIIIRSRYVFFALIVFTGLALVMDQGRDVLYSIAYQPRAWQSWAIFGISSIGMWSFGFACWLWTRSVCLMQSPDSPNVGALLPITLEDRFAKDWARILGLAPALLFVLLSAATMRDALWAKQTEAVWFIGCFTVLGLVGGFLFIWLHVRDEEKHFFNCISFEEWHEVTKKNSHVEGEGIKYIIQNAISARYKLFGVITPFWLPFYAITAMFICRILPSDGIWPPTVIATFLFSLTFWLSILGWISLNEERIAIPWIALIVLVIGLIGYGGLTQNHIVGDITVTDNIFHEFYAVLIAIPLLILFSLFVSFNSSNEENCKYSAIRKFFSLTDGKSGLSFARGGLFVFLTLFACSQLALLADKRVADDAKIPQGTENPKELGVALSTWLNYLMDNEAKLTDEKSGKLYVNFVNAEGGGIRAAYWAAIVLHELQKNNTTFLERTFSYSGVSGGSLGVAVNRACRLSKGDQAQCVEKFGSTDMLSPLVAVWMFEDVLAQFVPTKGCTTPGCGFMSRGVSFEQAMLRAVPELSNKLVRTQTAKETASHEPYLFLNSTWVESGERSIASDIKISPDDFPTSRDQFELLGKSLTLSTAAHNSARFPFVNAIGSVRDKNKDTIGHLADGGYFDNSGGHTTRDLLKALGKCLAPGSTLPGCDDRHFESKKKWLRDHLLPQVIMIRNGVGKVAVHKFQPDQSDIVFSLTKTPYQPNATSHTGEMKLYVDFLGPLVTAVNTTGIGANGRLAEANLGLEVKALWNSWRPGIHETTAPVCNIDQLEDNRQLYPLGWHLSKGAMDGMRQQIAVFMQQQNTSLPCTVKRDTKKI